MKIFSSTHEFNYSWEEVSTANWQKYSPWNKESEHVIAVDTLSRRLDPQSGVLRTERLITCKQAAPRWLLTFMGGTDVSHVYEVSYITPPSASQKAAPEIKQDPTVSHLPRQPAVGERDPQDAPPSLPPSTSSLPEPPLHPQPRSPSVTMLSVNLTWGDLLEVRETVSYTPAPDAPDIHSGHTRFEQNARITALCGGWQKIREKIELFTVERFGQNAERGRKGFEGVLEMSRRAWREKEQQMREQERASL